MDELRSELSASVSAQQQRSEDQTRDYDELEATVRGLLGNQADLEARLGEYKRKEDALRGEIAVLKRQGRQASRESLEGFRAATAGAREELEEVRGQLDGAKADAAALRRELEHKVAALADSQHRASAEASARQEAESLLGARQADIDRQRARLRDAERAKFALDANLAAAQERFAEAETKRQEEQGRVADLEAEITAIIESARDAEAIGRSLQEEAEQAGGSGEEGDAPRRRWWPFGR
uniref:Uncharacterized protein n=1 Tax=Zooxanthella nutricula TaxID=1333877 RepID=A0A7S2LDD4_9DINO